MKGSRFDGWAAGALSALVAASAAQADTGRIYRCTTDDRGVVYSELPCDETAEPFQLEGRISVVESASNLTAIAESNEAFLESQRADRDARREAEARQRQADRERARRVPPMMVPVPVYLDPRRRVGPIDRPPVPERTERLQQGGDRTRPATDERRRPISPLSGRQLGARRDIDEDG